MSVVADENTETQLNRDGNSGEKSQYRNRDTRDHFQGFWWYDEWQSIIKYVFVL